MTTASSHMGCSLPIWVGQEGSLSVPDSGEVFSLVRDGRVATANRVGFADLRWGSDVGAGRWLGLQKPLSYGLET